MAGATRYDDLARAIADAYPSLPNRLQGLARYALDNPDAMALATVARRNNRFIVISESGREPDARHGPLPSHFG